jgi:hypothetical protein
MALPLISHFFCSRKFKVFNLLYLISLFYFVQEKFNRWKDSSPYLPIPFFKETKFFNGM